MPSLPAPIYRPRCLVVLSVILDDQVPGSPGLFATFDAIPRNVEVRKNSSRKCDECFIELDYRDFPLDPRMVRSAHVAVHIEDALDPQLPLIPSVLNLRFIGNVDEPDTTLGEDRQTVRLACRDYTAIYLGRSWTACALPLPVPGSVVPANVIATPPGARLFDIVETIRLQITPDTFPTLVLDPKAEAAVPYLRSGRKTYVPKDKEESSWDVLCGLCDLFGLVPEWDLDVLTIKSPSQPGIMTAVMIYGQNVSSLTFKRTLTRKGDTKPVEVISWNPTLGLALTSGPYPAPKPGLTTETGIPKPAIPPTVQYHIEGPYTVPDLVLLAQSVYTESARGKIEGSLETSEMRDTLLQPLLGLKNGDRISVRLSPFDANSIAGMSQFEAALYLSNPLRPNSVNPAVAALLAQAWTAANALSVTFYITEVTHKWDQESGYRLSIQFSEFVLGV